MANRGLSFYLACLYIFVTVLAFCTGLCVWIARAFSVQQFEYVW